MESHQQVEAIVLSALALNHARRGDWEKVVEIVKKLDSEEFAGGAGIQLLMLSLADTVVIHQGGPPDPDDVFLPVFADTAGNVSDVDEVRREIAWAGRFIAARAAGDYPSCAALVNSITDDEEWAQRVYGLLEVAATTLNMLDAPMPGAPRT